MSGYIVLGTDSYGNKVARCWDCGYEQEPGGDGGCPCCALEDIYCPECGGWHPFSGECVEMG